MIHAAIAWVKEADNRYVVLVGDLLNMATKASVSDTYAQTMSPQAQQDMMVRLLEPIRERIVGVLRGNHDFRAYKESGLDPVANICAIAGLPYFEDEAYLNLKVGHWAHNSRANGRTPVNYIGLLDHGTGGGRMSGGKLNSAMRARTIFAADFYISGHGHDPIIKPDVRWRPDVKCESIIEEQQFFIVCGASLRRRPAQGYASRFGYRPLAAIWPVLTLDGTKKHMKAATE
jgi:predicted phosphodiesterase